MKIEDLMTSDYGSIKRLRELQDQAHEKDWRAEQREIPPPVMIPVAMAGPRVTALKELIGYLINGADGDLEKNDQGICCETNDITWQRLIKEEKEWAKEMVQDLNKPKKYFNARFKAEILGLHETAFFEVTDDHRYFSRYIEVIEGIWRRMLDTGKMYREIKLASEVYEGVEGDLFVSRKRGGSGSSAPAPKSVVNQTSVAALKEMLNKLKK